MVGSEYSTNNYKSLRINIGAIIKDPEMLRFVHDHLKTKMMCKYKTRQMCEDVILENGGTLKFVPDCYKNRKVCNKAVDNYAYALEFVPDYFKTQKMCNT